MSLQEAPSQQVSFLKRRKAFFYTLLTGGSGALLSVVVTYLCVEYIFGIEEYFTAYLLGVVCGVVYAFAVFAFAVFKTTERLVRKFALFSGYMAVLVIVQAAAVNMLVPIVGSEYYLVVIVGVIAALSIVNYGVYANIIFRT
jgi:putative flippase GtrA